MLKMYDILFNATKHQLLYFSKDSNNDNVQPVLSMSMTREFVMLLNVYIWITVLYPEIYD